MIPGMIARIKKYIGYNGGDGVAKKIKERLKKGDVRMICYVILHYKNMDDTIKCVESLNNTADCSSRYIIVDNGSGDGSGEKLELLYRDNAQCNVLILPENLGFSKGNNEGYQYAKQKFHPDYIVITNNDVVFFQKDFEKKIMQIINDLREIDGFNNNPLNEKYLLGYYEERKKLMKSKDEKSNEMNVGGEA